MHELLRILGPRRAITVAVGIVVFAGFVALPYLLMVLTVIVAMRERRLVHLYRRTSAGARAADGGGGIAPTEKAIAENRAAEAGGFAPIAACVDAHGGRYRINYDFWLSPDRTVLALVSDGKLGPVAVGDTRLISILADGRCLTSINSLSIENDLTGVREFRIDRQAGWPSRLAAHARYVAESGAPARPFSADPIGDFEGVKARQAEILEAEGLGGFLDPGRDAHRYTLRGALTLARRQRVESRRRALELHRKEGG